MKYIIIKNINRRTALTVLLLFSVALQSSFFTLHSSLLHAQDDARQRQVYAQAESDYQIGRTEQARDSLLLYLKTFQGNLRQNALRLIALTYLESFDIKQTENYAGMLLKQNPYYTVSSQDPPEFADIVSRIKAAMTVTITTASSQAETIEEAPLPVTLITEEMIRDCGAHDLRQLLTTYVPGMIAAEGTEPFVVMRELGLQAESQDKLLVMLNGHRLNNYSTNVGRLDYSMSLSKVKRIEVVRGPASSLYGGSAYTGVVNIITKTGADIDGLQVGAAAGNHGQLKGSVLFGKSLPYLDITAWANVFKTDGQKTPYEQTALSMATNQYWTWRGDITTGVYNHKPAIDFGAVVRWKGLTFMHNTHSSNYVIPVSDRMMRPFDYTRFPSINGNKPGISLASHHTSIDYYHQWGPWTLKAGIDYDVSNDQKYSYLSDSAMVWTEPFYDKEKGDMVFDVEGAYRYFGWSSRNLKANLMGAWSYTIGNGHQGTITFGLQSARFTFNDYQAYSGVNYSRIIESSSDWRNRDHHEKNASTYLQVKHRWGSLIANVGLRFDHVERRSGKTDNELSPRMALILLQPRWGARLCYSTSFVDVAFRHRMEPEEDIQDERLLPEYSRCWQLSLWGKQLFKGFNAEVSAFYSTAENTLGMTGFFYEGTMRSLGVEVAADYTLGKFKCLANASWKRIAEDNLYINSSNDDPYANPAFTAHATVAYQLLPTLRLHANAHFIGKRNLYDASYPYHHAPGVMLFDLGANWSWRNFGVNANIHNLLGTEYWQAGETIFYNVPQQRRWFLVELTYKF